MSGVVEANKTRSISLGLSCFLANKSSAAFTAKKPVALEVSFKMRLSFIPVREVIQSSLVSTIVSKIVLVKT